VPLLTKRLLLTRWTALLLPISPVLFFLLSCLSTAAQEAPRLREADRVRLAEAFRLGKNLGHKVWKGWSVPFAVLLVTPDYEFLVRHPSPTPEFKSLGYDQLLKSDVLWRKRLFAPNLLATFPAVNGVSTIVVGQPENTAAKDSTRWVITVLHEHFHQWQESQPGYFDDVARLGLVGDDTSGMWMLNYPFPYDDVAMNRWFPEIAKHLTEAVHGRKPKEHSAPLFEAAFITAFKQGRDQSGDYKYLSFQLWKEGVARYTELRMAELAAREFRPGPAFQSLPDFVPFSKEAERIREGIFEELRTYRLSEARRAVFYPLGAAMAMLLDRIEKGWKKKYLAEKFRLYEYLRTTIVATVDYRDRR